MKKLFTAIYIIAAVFILTSLALFLAGRNTSLQEKPPETERESTYDPVLYSEFCQAEAEGDYIEMNRIYDENTEKTGVGFFAETEYDPTHGGVIYTYPYTVKVGEEYSGKLYFVSDKVDITWLSYDKTADYIAVDCRSRKNPEVVVIDSYRAESEGLITELCEILLSHEDTHPSQWSRTLKSMVEEWEIHNAAYAMNYKPEHSKDVNLDNADEDTDWFRRSAEEFSSN